MPAGLWNFRLPLAVRMFAQRTTGRRPYASGGAADKIALPFDQE